LEQFLRLDVACAIEAASIMDEDVYTASADAFNASPTLSCATSMPSTDGDVTRDFADTISTTL